MSTYDKIYNLLLGTNVYWSVRALSGKLGIDAGTIRAELREGRDLGHFEHTGERAPGWQLTGGERFGYALWEGRDRGSIGTEVAG
jgi:hypothetical protein